MHVWKQSHRPISYAQDRAIGGSTYKAWRQTQIRPLVERERTFCVLASSTRESPQAATP